MKSFAIVIVGYNRINGIKRLLRGLEKVDYEGRKDIHLIFSIDYSGDSNIEDFAKAYKWNFGEKHIRAFKERQGLKKHILECGNYANIYDIVCVFEDDIFVSDSFYHYAYGAANFYWNDERIAGISLYNFQKNWLNWILRFEPQKTDKDAYFLRIAQSWGQVWTRKKWSSFIEWYHNNTTFNKTEDVPEYLNTWPETSWLKYQDKYCIETKKYFVYPYISLSTNYSDVGEHSKYTISDHQVELQFGKRNFLFPDLSDQAVSYDEYMDREHIGKYLNVSDLELCVDFWGNKRKNQYKKYLLSTRKLDYKIVHEYSLSLRPIELNAILGVAGNDIFLYDTTIVSKNPYKNDNGLNLKLYSLRSHDEKELLNISFKLALQNVPKKIKSKLMGLFNK